MRLTANVGVMANSRGWSGNVQDWLVRLKHGLPEPPRLTRTHGGGCCRRLSVGAGRQGRCGKGARSLSGSCCQWAWPEIQKFLFADGLIMLFIH